MTLQVVLCVRESAAHEWLQGLKGSPKAAPAPDASGRWEN